MSEANINPRRRSIRTLRLFFSLVLSFLLQYLKARLTGHTYDFFTDSAHNRQRAIKIRKAAIAQGGVLIKVGQFLSSRVDLLPTEYIEELALLQDEVPALPFSEIQPILEADLGGSLESFFTRFDTTPLAAASLGQVYRASLRTGEHVAVKVQRPHIGQIVEADLATLRYIVGWIHRHTPIQRRADLPQILREFEDTLRLELDYRREGHHAERIAILFHDSDDVAVPRIYWSHSRGRVLTMQYMWGTKVTDFAALEEQGISRSRAAEILMWAYLKMVLQDGFFHADPHPGNIFVRPGPVIVFLDYGMVGDISPEMRDNIRRVFLGIIRRDFDQVLLALASLGFITRDADMGVLKRALIWTVDTFYEMSFAELRAVDPEKVLDQLQEVFYTESFHIPANFAFLGRALGTLSGLCTALDPSFQFVTIAEPFARDLLGRDRGILGTLSRVGGEARSLAATAYALPYLTHSALERVQVGELDFRRHVEQVVRSIDRVERAARRIMYGLLVTGLIVAAAYVYSRQHALFALAAFIAALILLFRVIILSRRRR